MKLGKVRHRASYALRVKVLSHFLSPHLRCQWVETQRYEYTKLQRLAEEILADEKFDGEETSAMKARRTNQRLTEERLLRLESIGFEWKVKHKMKRYYDKQWDQMFERYAHTQKTCFFEFIEEQRILNSCIVIRLLAYKAANGHW